jgi:glucosylceramidase
VDAVLQDPLAASFIKGVGFQWAGKGVIAEVQKKYPSMKLMQTESECGDGSNDWAAMEYTFSLMEHYFAHGAESYLYWNMVLDETGRSQWGWKQNSLVTIGPAGDITYHPEYYLMRHLSAKVSKGARLIEMENGPGRCIAFLNPQGSMVVVVLNPEEEAKAFSFKAGDAGFLNVELPGRSLHTFTIPQ